MVFAVRYLWEHAEMILMQLLFCCVFAVVFYLYHLPLAAVMYPAAICLLLGCLFAGRAVRAAYRRHRELTRLQGAQELPALLSLPENAVCGMVSAGAKTVDRDYQQLISALCRRMQAREDEMADSHREMMEYFTMWVHQIKTPIASMRLHLDGEDSGRSRRLRSELLRIEQYVEMVLTYLRLGSRDTDYVFARVDLDLLLRGCIRKYAGQFIRRHLALDYQDVDCQVLTDEKWLAFVVEQVLSNALKYTREGSVRIYMESPCTLCVRDTGIGISPEDLPRIFEKGYTGYNGRSDKKATGLGLYLCRQICDRLRHTITVSSAPGEGTTVRIGLGREVLEVE